MTINQDPVQTQDSQKQVEKDHNFALINKKLKYESEARLLAEARVEELEKLNARGYEDDDSEPYVDHKKLERRFASFEQNIEKKIEEKAEQKARAMLEEEKRNTYLRDNNDFNQTMHQDNIQKFADMYPKLAENILKMPEGFERQKLVYENIKALGVDKPVARQQSVQEKIDANRKSPFYQPSGQATAPYSTVADYSPAGMKNGYEQMKALQKQLRLG